MDAQRVTVDKYYGERPCLHDNCSVLHWGRGVWDGVDHIVADTYWRVVDSETYESLYPDVDFPTKTEAVAWAKRHFPDSPIAYSTTGAPVKEIVVEPEFDDLTNIQQAKAVGMLASTWVRLSDSEQRGIWSERSGR